MILISMPVVAVVLIACEAGRYHEVAERVAKIRGVTRAFPCFGRWDVVARIEADDLDGIADVALRINGLKNVRASETLICAVP